jgi:uncharacterized DUF497 family protein
MEIEFDSSKAAANLKKHGVSFQEAATCLLDPVALVMEDRDAEGKQRFVQVGMSSETRLFSFRPERVLFRPCDVNLRACLCGVPMYASAQTLDFLAWTKNSSFPNRKPIVSHPEFPDGN